MELLAPPGRSAAGPSRRRWRRQSTVAAGLLMVGVAACSAGPDRSPARDGVARDTPVGSAPVVLEKVTEAPREAVPSALDFLENPDLPAPLVDPVRIRSGGPPPDGIPAIDQPTFERADVVRWIADDEPVIALDQGHEHRAYPVQVMIWHEIVNDSVAGSPVTVTYCPLCNSALAFDRRVGDRELSFGTSGKLYLSALVMYDRQTESLWSQIEHRAIAGYLTGEAVTLVPVQMLSWSQWVGQHPDGWVLSRDTGFDRSYGTNPYVGYDDPEGTPFLFDGETDGRLKPMTRVVGLAEGSDVVAIRQDALLDGGVVSLTLDGRPVALRLAAGLSSALDGPGVAGGRDIGATGAFEARVGQDVLTFSATDDGRFTDEETGSTWSITGQAIDGPLRGTALRPINHLDTFWFAWVASNPSTQVIQP